MYLGITTATTMQTNFRRTIDTKRLGRVVFTYNGRTDTATLLVNGKKHEVFRLSMRAVFHIGRYAFKIDNALGWFGNYQETRREIERYTEMDGADRKYFTTILEFGNSRGVWWHISPWYSLTAPRVQSNALIDRLTAKYSFDDSHTAGQNWGYFKGRVKIYDFGHLSSNQT